MLAVAETFRAGGSGDLYGTKNLIAKRPHLYDGAGYKWRRLCVHSSRRADGVL